MFQNMRGLTQRSNFVRLGIYTVSTIRSDGPATHLTSRCGITLASCTIENTRHNKQVAFWSAALDPNRDESSLSARLSALSGLRSGLAPDARREYLAKCVGLVAGARTTRGRRHDQPGDLPANMTDSMLLVLLPSGADTIFQQQYNGGKKSGSNGPKSLGVVGKKVIERTGVVYQMSEGVSRPHSGCPLYQNVLIVYYYDHPPGTFLTFDMPRNPPRPYPTVRDWCHDFSRRQGFALEGRTSNTNNDGRN